MLTLKKLNLKDSEQIYNFLQELPSENGFENQYCGMSKADFLNIGIPERLDSEKGINLKDGYVPDTYFFLLEDQTIIGLFKVRHYLNDFLRAGAGHIGYAIHPKFRKCGYATEGLRLAIIELKKIMPAEETEIYLSCNLDNIGSLKAQLNNNAYIHHQDEREYYTRIKI
jgi:predicted acetyltransferase